MNYKSKVSILIISYNEKKYLSRAIQSCLNQTYENIELLIGDDGSSDGSIEYIENLGGGIRYFIMPRDDGAVIPSIRVSNIVKEGLALSSGDYFVILSGDDYYIDNQMVSDAVEFLDKHTNIYAYVNGFQTVDENEHCINKVLPRQKNNILYWSGDYIHISCFVFRILRPSELLNRMCDDTGLEFILATKGKWKFSQKIVFAYRQRISSIQHKADQFELSLLEVMIYQDILNSIFSTKKMFLLFLASQSRFYRSIKYILEQREELSKLQYRKYIESCALYNNNLIKEGNVKKKDLVKMHLCNLLFSVFRKINWY